MAELDRIQQKIELIEQEKQNGDLAASVLQQFIDAGYVKQDKDGGFTVPSVSKERKFMPFEGQ